MKINGVYRSYLMHEEDNCGIKADPNVWKFGISALTHEEFTIHTIKLRKRALSQGNPRILVFDLYYFKTENDALAFEENIHLRFSQFSLFKEDNIIGHGEWFYKLNWNDAKIIIDNIYNNFIGSNNYQNELQKSINSLPTKFIVNPIEDCFI